MPNEVKKKQPAQAGHSIAKETARTLQQPVIGVVRLVMANLTGGLQIGSKIYHYNRPSNIRQIIMLFTAQVVIGNDCHNS
jgi:hypothetical protein